MHEALGDDALGDEALGDFPSPRERRACDSTDVASDAPFEAAVRHVFELGGRGTVLGVEIRAGTVTAGDTIEVPAASGGVLRLAVRAVEYIDGCLPPLPESLVGLVVDGIRSDEVAIGGTIRGTLRP